MPESTNPRNRQPLARNCPGLLDSLVSCDSSADQGRGIDSRKAIRNMSDIVGIRKDVLGKTTVLGIAAKLRLGAHGLPSGPAILAVPARRVQPGNPNPVPLLD